MSGIAIIDWGLFAAFGAIFVLCAATNLWLMFIAPRRRPEGACGPSPVPVIGGLFGAIALAQLPFEGAKAWFWLPLILDPGCIPFLLIAWRASHREPAAAKPPITLPEAAAAQRRACVGCLLGTAVGDALGLPAEGLSKRRAARLFPDLSSYRLFFGRGLTSDDTEHACMTAQALINAATLPAPLPRVEVFRHNLGWRLRFWLLGLPAGVGAATGRAILKLWLGFPADRSGVDSAGNGPAMRAPILGVYAGDAPELLRPLIAASTRLTHTDPRAEEGAFVVAVAAHYAAFSETVSAEGLDRRLAVAGVAEGETLAVVRRALASVTAGETSAEFAASIGCADGVSGYMLHTLPVALHAWLRQPEQMPEALAAVIRCGGDTDTLAAITGALVGARVGKAGIPPHLLEHLIEWPRSVAWIERVGETLAESKVPGRYAAPVPLFLPGVLLRNLVFLAIVLGHGLRRLLPPY